jgi:hypothetical protein
MEGQRCKSGGPCLDASCGPSSCSAVAEWVGTGSGSFDASDNVSAMEVPSPTDPTMLLRMEVYHEKAPAMPHVVNNDRTSLSDCKTAGACAWIGTGCSSEFSTCKERFLVLSGKIEVIGADALPSGTMSATIEKGWLVQWDAARDRAAKGWQCLDLGWAGLSASW